MRDSIVGRPREFDTDFALERAMETFWNYGFEASSLDKLCQSMGIARSSLYQAFGDKHSLLLAALDIYDKRVKQRIQSTFTEDLEFNQALRVFLTDLIDAAAGADRRGCFLGNFTGELAPRDTAATDRLRQSMDRLEAHFAAAIADAQRKGQFSSDRDSIRTARFLFCSIQGLRIIAKTNPGQNVLDDLIDDIISSLH